MPDHQVETAGRDDADARVGLVVDEYVIAVDEGKIREFATAIGDPAPRYTGRAEAVADGYDAVPAPLTFAVTAAHHRDASAAAGKLGLAMERIVVGEVGWVYERPVLAGDVLRGRRFVDGVRHREGSRGGGMTLMTLVTEFRDPDDDVVLRQRETLIETGPGGGGATKGPAAAGLPDVPEDVRREVGPVTRTDIVRFAGASGDFNPLHHDEQHARAAGFPTVFAMGQYQAGLLSRLATDWLGLRNIVSYRVRFNAKVWPGDQLVLTGRERARAHDDARGSVVLECDLEARRRDGEVAIRASVTALATRPGDGRERNQQRRIGG